MSSIKIEVTAKDIRLGNRRHCCLCPVGLAVRRATRHRVLVVSVTSAIYWVIRCTSNGVKVLRLPKKAQQFANAFDHNRKVKPFSFRLSELC